MASYYFEGKNYIPELELELQKERDYREFKEKFKEFDIYDIVQMYHIKLVNNINDTLVTENVTKEDKAERLNKIGIFLNKTRQLNILKNIQNEKILEATEESLGKDNIFIITKKQLLKEFDKNYNLDKKEEILDMKNIFWENKVTKILESLRICVQSKYSVENNKDKMEVNDEVKNVNDILSFEDSNLSNVYKEFLNNKISKEEFEKTDEFKKAKNIINEFNKESKNNFKIYEIINIFALEENISISYLEKHKNIEHLVLNNSDINIGYRDLKKYPDNNLIEIKSRKNVFSHKIEVHQGKKELDKILEKKDIPYIGKVIKTKKIIPNIVLVEFSDDKVAKIKEMVKDINNPNNTKIFKKALKQYGINLEMEIPIIKNDKEKSDKNNINNRNRYYKNKSRKRDSFERGDR